ncbi:MAG: helix-turn-helix transcriptional regulator [Muribaculaceae bacterium]|nr:helix-turn-helix transcriptional regulator [Muribaculaceae bacterium]
MAIYNKETRLTDAIMHHPSLIPVVGRLGVTLGVGDETISSTCETKGIDVSFFLSIVNTFIDEQYFPANPQDTFTLGKTIDYLEKTSRYYLQSQLPNIERHFISLIQKSGGDNNLDLLMKFFREASHQLRESIKYDSEILYRLLLSGEVPEDYEYHSNEHSEVEERFHDLLYFFVAHLKGEYDHNLCMAVISAVFTLEKDIIQNNRIRQRILQPKIEELRSEKK